MRMLIVEDDFASRKLLVTILAPFGQCDVAVDGAEAVAAFRTALDKNEGYNLICLDIMLPKMDGQQVLTAIRGLEAERGIALGEQGRSVSIVMTTALDDSKSLFQSVTSGCEAYIPKPITKDRLLRTLREIGVL